MLGFAQQKPQIPSQMLDLSDNLFVEASKSKGDTHTGKLFL